MGCNAYNHRPGCDCGWGGVFYPLGLLTGVSYWGRNESYTNPNAHCPRCGALVFFYRSPEGGSVYFDDLGPPWPKHPCMDTGERSLSAKRAKQVSSTPSWLAGGWHPLPCDGIEIFKSDARLIAVSVSMGEDRMHLYAKRQAATIKPHSPMLWKRKDGLRGHYEISTVDHSSPGFREVRFDACNTADEMLAIVRQELVAKECDPFVKRLDSIKNRLLEGGDISGLAAKMDAIIERFRQRLIDGGDSDTLESLASAAMKSLLVGEANRLEKVSQASALHEALVAEGRRLANEFVEFEGVIRGPLKEARLFAVHKLLQMDAAASLMRKAALDAIAAHKAQLNRRANAQELDLFIDELVKSEGLGGNATSKMRESARKSFNRNIGAESIKLNMAEIARACKEVAAIEMLRMEEKEKGRQERLKLISELLDETCKSNPGIDRLFLEKSIVKKINSGTPIEGIRNTLEADVNGWLKSNVRKVQTEANRSAPRRPKDGRHGGGSRNSGVPVNSTNVGNSSAGSNRQPFNSALADKLAYALMNKK